MFRSPWTIIRPLRVVEGDICATFDYFCLYVLVLEDGVSLTGYKLNRFHPYL
jgi:hypothetical protein